MGSAFEETLIRLSAKESLDDRLRNSWSEIDVIEKDDVTDEHYKAIENWKNRYQSRTRLSINLEGEMENGNCEEMHLLLIDLQKLCNEIIDINAKEVKKES